MLKSYFVTFCMHYHEVGTNPISVHLQHEGQSLLNLFWPIPFFIFELRTITMHGKELLAHCMHWVKPGICKPEISIFFSQRNRACADFKSKMVIKYLFLSGKLCLHIPKSRSLRPLTWFQRVKILKHLNYTGPCGNKNILTPFEE